jgi:hypothetical protein
MATIEVQPIINRLNNGKADGTFALSLHHGTAHKPPRD